MAFRWFAALVGASLLFCASAHAQPSETERTMAREIFARLISFDTSVEGRQNPQMAEYLADRLRQGGFPASDIHVVRHNETAAFVARYRGDGTGGRPIIIMAHMDVVNARRADWERDPFTLIEEDGFFFGRGTADIKAGIAITTTMFLTLKAEGFTPTRDLILVFTGDEETSGATSRLLLSQHRELVDAEFALNADGGGGVFSDETGAPMGYQLQTAEKSYASYTLTARNPGGHSSVPRPDNAIYELADALNAVRGHTFPVMWNDTTLASLRAEGAATPGALGQAMLRFARNPRDRRAAATISASPDHAGQIRTTCVATMLQAGHADNALPQSAVATVNCRIFPGISIESVQAQLQSLVGPGIAVAQFDEYWSSDASPLREDVLAAVTAAVQASYPGVPITPGMSVGATDGVFFRGAGIPTYGVSEIFVRPSEDFSHGLNERIRVTAFYNGLTHWRVLITQLAGAQNASAP